ncbi:MAG TPA: hypothetical protein PKL04_00700 [Methanofastidiosum sp.]|nr:hypothetical protein [Methanofastidiosum sp.]
MLCIDKEIKMRKIISYEKFQAIILLGQCVNPDCDEMGHEDISEYVERTEIRKTYQCDKCKSKWTIHYQPKIITEIISREE